MEKFALLNLLKALDGLKSADADEKTDKGAAPTAASARPSKTPTENAQSFEIPNIMYEALMRHETVSNRLKNKK